MGRSAAATRSHPPERRRATAEQVFDVPGRVPAVITAKWMGLTDPIEKNRRARRDHAETSRTCARDETFPETLARDARL